MLLTFTQMHGQTVYISPDHVQQIAPSGTGSALLMADGTVLTVTLPPATAMAMVNAGLTTFLTTDARPIATSGAGLAR